MKKYYILISKLLVILCISGILSGCSNKISNGDKVEIIFDSRYYVYAEGLIKTELFSYNKEIYVPLQGIFEAEYMSFMWDESAQTASVTHNWEVTPILEEIALNWIYPKLSARGNNRVDYVRFLEFDIDERTLVCEGRDESYFRFDEQEKIYTFTLSEQEKNRFQELIYNGLETDDLYRLVAYFPWPMTVGPPHPNSLAPLLVELTYPYYSVQQAIVRPITINFTNIEVNGVHADHISMNALEYDDQLYISITALEKVIPWFSHGILNIE